MNLYLKELYARMAKLTKDRCGPCPTSGTCSCCSPEYCAMAQEIAEEQGVVLKPTGNEKLPFMGPNGCVVPPYFRPLCTVHICDKLLYSDVKFLDEYFKLRNEINVMEMEEQGYK